MGTDVTDPLIGQRFGQYEIRSLLGKGGMAAVYAAYQSNMERDVAIKVIRTDRATMDASFQARFEREAKTIAALQHVHILPVIDYGSYEDYAYLAMRLLNTSLKNYIKESHPIPFTKVATLLRQIADALDYAHEKGVVHRDLKPENILLDDKGNCFLADFGIAYLIDSSVALTQEGMTIGTPAYMSPEQIRGERATVASDTYALGIMLYEMVTGQLPFTGETTVAVIHQHLTTPPEPPRKLRADLPSGCEQIMLKALAKDPAERPLSADELAKEFAEAATNPVSAEIATGSHEEQISEHTKTVIGKVPLQTQPTDSATELVDYATAKKRSLPLSTRWGGVAVAALIVFVGTFYLLGIANGKTDETATGLRAADYNTQGIEALANLDYTTAIENFQAAIQLEPDNAAAFYNLGVAYEEQGKSVEAKDSYQKALELDNQLLLASYRLGELLLDDGDVDAGFQVADEALRVLQLSNTDIDAAMREQLLFSLYTTRGQAYYLRASESSLSLARADLQQAIALKDAVTYPAPAYYYMALVLEAQQDDEAAQDAWLDFLATYDPNNARHREWAIQARSAIQN